MSRKLLALLCALYVAFLPSIALAQVPATTDEDPVAHTLFGRVGVYDPLKILRITEEYPIQTGVPAPFVEANAVPVTTGFKIMGNGWTAYPYQFRGVTITRVGTAGAAVDRSYLYLFSSDDNIIWNPVTSPTSLVVGNSVAADTAKVDTMMVALPSAPASQTWFLPLPTQIYGYLGRYLAFGAKRDSTNGTAMTMTITWLGRSY